MNIISGIARSIRLDVPKGQGVRPTAVRSRKALFDSLGNLDGIRVLDLFAGAGGLGLEAASIGAEAVTFVEKSPKHVKLLKQNIARVEKAGVSAEIRVITGNVLAAGWQATVQSPDIVFADPPYAESPDYYNRLLAMESFQRLAGQALLIWECPRETKDLAAFPPSAPWQVEKKRTFAGVDFLYLRVEPE